MDHTIIRQKQLDIGNILKIIHAVYESSGLAFTDLYTHSKIRMKAVFLNYLNFCADMGFIRKYEDAYIITSKGQIFYGLMTK